MPSITYYRQARRDHGIRSGIDIDEDTVLSKFERPGSSKDQDPALLWYVDVRCQGKKLPRDPEAARRWFVGHGTAIADVLRLAAQEVPAGSDPGDWPVQFTKAIPQEGVKISVVYSAVRRAEALHMAEILLEIADRWQSRIEELAALPAA